MKSLIFTSLAIAAAVISSHAAASGMFICTIDGASQTEGFPKETFKLRRGEAETTIYSRPRPCGEQGETTYAGRDKEYPDYVQFGTVNFLSPELVKSEDGTILLLCDSGDPKFIIASCVASPE